MARPALLFTRHAEDMLIERGIDRAWVETTIYEPESVDPDPAQPGVFRAYRRIAERGGRFLRVVYVPGDQNIRVLTAFFDRTRRN